MEVGIMAGHRGCKRSRRSQNPKAHRRRAVGLGGGVGAFLAFGIGPLAGAPPARADIEDLVIEPLINFLGPLAGLVEPAAGLDLSGLGSVADAAPVSDPLAAL